MAWKYAYGETIGQHFNTGATRVYQSEDGKVGLMRRYSHDKLRKEVYFPWDKQELEFSSEQDVRNYYDNQDAQT